MDDSIAAIQQIIDHWQLSPSSRLDSERNFFEDVRTVNYFLTSSAKVFAGCGTAVECAQRHPEHGAVLTRLCDSKWLLLNDDIKLPLFNAMIEFSKSRLKGDHPGEAEQSARKWCASRIKAIADLGRPEQVIANVVTSLCGSLELGGKVREAFLQDLDEFLNSLEASQITMSSRQSLAISEFLVPLLSQQLAVKTLDSLVSHLARAKVERRSFSKSFVGSLGDQAAYQGTFRRLELATKDFLWKRHPELVGSTVSSLVFNALMKVEVWASMEERRKSWKDLAPARYFVQEPEIFRKAWGQLQHLAVSNKDSRTVVMVGSFWDYFFSEWRKGSPVLHLQIHLFRYLPPKLRPFCQVVESSSSSEVTAGYCFQASEFWRQLQDGGWCADIEGERTEMMQGVWFFLVAQRKLLHWCALHLHDNPGILDFLSWCFFPEDRVQREMLATALESFWQALQGVKKPLNLEGMEALATFLEPTSHFRFVFILLMVPVLKSTTFLWQVVKPPSSPPDLVSLCHFIEGTEIYYAANSKYPQHLEQVMFGLQELLQASSEE